jgi:AraC-like DNA-binding protein
MWTNSLFRLVRTNPVIDNRSLSLDFFFEKTVHRIKLIEPLILVWWCFALSIMGSAIARASVETTSFTYYALVIVGSGGCIWFWLLSRLLFRKKKDLGPKIVYVVPVVISIEAISALMAPVGGHGLANEAGRVFDNAASMVCIAAIVFVWYEILYGYKEIRTAAERRFRVAFMTGFSLLIGITILWVSGASIDSFAANWNAALLTACAFIALAGTRIAIQYRLNNLLEKPTRCDSNQLALSDEETSKWIAQRMLEAIKDESLLTRPNLKVSEFAEQIGEQEYKVTRCITNRLQYRNFNHFLNSYRIDRAKRIFKDPDNNHLTIATVAYDSGFNSLGPFNRAFRQFTGMTPREFRLK